MPSKKSKEQFISNAILKHGNRYTYENVIYINSKTKVQIDCSIHGAFFQQPNAHLNGNKCPSCSGKKVRSTEEFINQCIDIHGNLYDYSNVDYKNNKQKIKIICKEHDNEIELYARSHLSGVGCTKCKIKKYIPLFKQIHNNYYSYEKSEYNGYNKQIIITCPVHGDFYQNPFYHLDGCGCSQCTVFLSKGELYIKKFLEDNDIYFLQQKRFDDCKNTYTLPFDFYIPHKNTCIEYDGEQHFSPIEYFGGDEIFERQVQNDNIKNEYCNKHNIQLLRIRYGNIENIPSILSKVLYG